MPGRHRMPSRTRRTVTETLTEASADGGTAPASASTRDTIYGLIVVLGLVILLVAVFIGLLAVSGMFTTCCTRPAPSPW
jgi:hypothetical protein